jgi:hypothetical protein
MLFSQLKKRLNRAMHAFLAPERELERGSEPEPGSASACASGTGPAPQPAPRPAGAVSFAAAPGASAVQAAPQVWKHTPTLAARPGIGCPRCQQHIEVSIPVLLSGMPITCPHCALELKVNREKSKDSFEALEKLNGSFSEASRMMDRATGKH